MGSCRRNHFLQCSDGELLRRCRIDRFRGSGRGGQKRNVTESAVRLTLTDLNISASSDVSRSQHRNRYDAVRHLRRNIALAIRCPPPEHHMWQNIPSVKNPNYHQWLAELLDVLHSVDYRVGAAAVCFGNYSTAKLVKVMARDADLWQKVNREREQRKMRPLQRPQS